MYVSPVEIFSGATIGKHVRHIYDFYQTIIKGAKDQLLDYNARDRDPLIELSPLHAIQVFTELSKEIFSMDELRFVQIRSDYDPSCDDDRCLVNSSIGRELLYAFDHAVHHLAIIKMGLVIQFPEFIIPSSMGVAPSTVKYQNLKEN